MRTFGLGLIGLIVIASGADLDARAGGPAPAVSAADDATATRKLARDELDRLGRDWHPSAAVIVVLDPRDGRIIASEGRLGAADAPTLASDHLWITGSTLKSLTLAAAIDAGVVTPDSVVDCAPRAYPEGQLTDWKTLGKLTLRDALAQSSNVGASRVLDALGLARLTAAYARLHVFDAPGAIPAVGDEHGIAAASLAAGELASTSPLRLAAAYATLFDGGRYHAPTADGHGATEVALAPATAAALLPLLENVVAGDLGTGHRAQIQGHRVAGKTGTAALASGLTYASFVGMVLDADPPRVILVGVELAPKDDATGGAVAAPAFARLAARLAR
ncbi:MAG: penicillin-binding transpeptidase domain-containing protein [Myxococcota bacterium]